MTTTLPTLPQRVERVRLWGYSEEIDTPVLSLLFGELVKRALPITNHYLSDLYHDARWLGEHVTGPTTFEFIVRNWGTYIGTNLDTVVGPFDDGRWGVLNRGVPTAQTWIRYRVDLTCERGDWFVTFTEVERSNTIEGEAR